MFLNIWILSLSLDAKRKCIRERVCFSANVVLIYALVVSLQKKPLYILDPRYHFSNIIINLEILPIKYYFFPIESSRWKVLECFVVARCRVAAWCVGYKVALRPISCWHTAWCKVSLQLALLKYPYFLFHQNRYSSYQKLLMKITYSSYVFSSLTVPLWSSR